MAVPNPTITPTGTVLALVGDPLLRDDVSRVAAAAGVGLVVVDEPSGRKAWMAAAAVLLDAPSAQRCAARALPRRTRVILVGSDAPRPDDWQAAIAIGAQHLVTLPGQDAELVAALSEAAFTTRRAEVPQWPYWVPEEAPGRRCSRWHWRNLRRPRCWSTPTRGAEGSTWWPAVRIWPACGGRIWRCRSGRLGYPALRDALPCRDGVSVLSSGRSGADIEAGPLGAVIDAGCRGGVTVVCDVPRRATEAAETALDAADLVVLVTPADVRSCTAAAAARPWVLACNPNAGVVVRGPSPGGLRAAEVARIVDLPMLAAMRAQAGIAEVLERGGLRVRPRSPLGAAARRVLAVLAGHPVQEAA